MIVLCLVISYCTEKAFFPAVYADLHKEYTKRFHDFHVSYLFTHEEESRWKRLLTVMLGTGLRIGELAGLRWCDIDFTNGIIRVEHSLVNFPHPGQKPSCTFEMHEPKTEAGYRSIPMLSFVREMLEQERAWQNETGEHSTMKVDGYDNFVFFNRFGQPHHQGTL